LSRAALLDALRAGWLNQVFTYRCQYLRNLRHEWIWLLCFMVLVCRGTSCHWEDMCWRSACCPRQRTLTDETLTNLTLLVVLFSRSLCVCVCVKMWDKDKEKEKGQCTGSTARRKGTATQTQAHRQHSAELRLRCTSHFPAPMRCRSHRATCEKLRRRRKRGGTLSPSPAVCVWSATTRNRVLDAETTQVVREAEFCAVPPSIRHPH